MNLEPHSVYLYWPVPVLHNLFCMDEPIIIVSHIPKNQNLWKAIENEQVFGAAGTNFPAIFHVIFGIFTVFHDFYLLRPRFIVDPWRYSFETLGLWKAGWETLVFRNDLNMILVVTLIVFTSLYPSMNFAFVRFCVQNCRSGSVQSWMYVTWAVKEAALFYQSDLVGSIRCQLPHVEWP